MVMQTSGHSRGTGSEFIQPNPSIDDQLEGGDALVSADSSMDQTANDRREARDQAAEADEEDRVKRSVKPLGAIGITALGYMPRANERKKESLRKPEPPVAPPID
jgi:hypothetical protein